MRKTKIVCTIGPAVDEINTLKNLMSAGMNVARVNFSHGNFEDQVERINNIKNAREEMNLPIPMLLDTKGPEIRIGKFKDDQKISISTEDEFTFVNEEILGDATKVYIDYKELYNDVSVGSKILVDDGNIEFEVTEVKGKDIVCKALNNGVISSRKSVNVPNLKINLPSLTEKDINDITKGIKAGLEYIAASFIRKEEDVLEIRKLLDENDGKHVKIISKIENREGIENFESILAVSDGIMVARGDLGVEIPIEEVPIIQKRFIKKCYRAGKPVITATQMLESMISNPRPTRAEVSDIANAIFDGTGAIMLSGESAVGKYPIECVNTMEKISKTVEHSIDYWKRFKRREYNTKEFSYEFNINHAVVSSAMEMNAKAIVVYTELGDTPRIISSFGPSAPIVAVTKNPVTYRQLGLSWNVHPVLVTEEISVDEMLKKGIDFAKENSILKEDDFVIVGGGTKVLRGNTYSDINRMIGGVVKV